jgi:membrane fusion protein, heavy metal efflux system
MRKYNFLKAVLFTLFVIALVSCGSGSKTKTEIKEAEVIPEDIVELREDQVKLADIETVSIELRSLSGTLKVSGTVTTSPQNLATVCLPMGGFVKNTLMVAGSAVSKGQILAVVENQDFVDIQQNYLEAKNKLEYAEAEFKRHTELYKEDVYSQKNLQQVTSDYKSLKAQVKALEQKLSVIGINPSLLNEDNITSDIQVISPISGYIKSVNINIGKYVAPSDAMFEIVNNNNPLLELTLFEKDADKVVNGQNIRFFINNETEQHTATIYQTGKTIGTDKTYKVYARVEGTCKNVLPGMYVNAIIETSLNKVTALPSEAIVSFDDKDYIFVYERAKEEEGKSFTEYRMLQVQKGSSDNGYTEVRLPENFDIQKSRVVIKGAYNLLSAKKNAGEMAC